MEINPYQAEAPLSVSADPASAPPVAKRRRFPFDIVTLCLLVVGFCLLLGMPLAGARRLTPQESLRAEIFGTLAAGAFGLAGVAFLCWVAVRTAFFIWRLRKTLAMSHDDQNRGR